MEVMLDWDTAHSNLLVSEDGKYAVKRSSLLGMPAFKKFNTNHYVYLWHPLLDGATVVLGNLHPADGLRVSDKERIPLC